MKSKKAQSAVEFLMTYGWAIVVVLVAIGTLSYFGIMDLGDMVPERCTFPTGIECVGTPAVNSADDTLMFLLQNDYGAAIRLTGGSTDSDGDCTATPTFCLQNETCASYYSTLDLEATQRAIVKLECSEDISKGKFKTDVIITYEDNLTGFSLQTQGQIRARAY